MGALSWRDSIERSTGTLLGKPVRIHKIGLRFLPRGQPLDVIGDFFRQHDGGCVEVTVGNLGEHGRVDDTQIL